MSIHCIFGRSTCHIIIQSMLLCMLLFLFVSFPLLNWTLSAVHGYQDLLALTIYMLISSNERDDVPRTGCRDTNGQVMGSQKRFWSCSLLLHWGGISLGVWEMNDVDNIQLQHADDFIWRKKMQWILPEKVKVYLTLPYLCWSKPPQNICHDIVETLTTQSCFGVKVLKTMPANLVEFM